MYHKYHTEAIVLRSYERGEADRVHALYTKEFGFVWARGSAVRRESSRMRYALQNYTVANVSLVRGMSGWRAAGAASVCSLGTGGGAAAFARVCSLLERLVRGEERNEYLFATLVGAHGALRAGEGSSIAAIELLAVARVLFALGYVSAEAVGAALFTTTAFTHEVLSEADSGRAKLLSSVNRAISETHL